MKFIPSLSLCSIAVALSLGAQAYETKDSGLDDQLKVESALVQEVSKTYLGEVRVDYDSSIKCQNNLNGYQLSIGDNNLGTFCTEGFYSAKKLEDIFRLKNH